MGVFALQQKLPLKEARHANVAETLRNGDYPQNNPQNLWVVPPMLHTRSKSRGLRPEACAGSTPPMELQTRATTVERQTTDTLGASEEGGGTDAGAAPRSSIARKAPFQASVLLMVFPEWLRNI